MLSKPAFLGALIAVLYVLLYIAPLDFRPLMIPDEVRYAQIPREMIKAETLLSPRFDGMKYFEKPSSAYWPTIASMKAFGESHFAVRLPMALSVGVSALLLFLLARRARGKDGVPPLLPVAIFLVSGEVFLVGTFAVLDDVFSMFLTAAMAAFYFAWTETKPLKRHGLLLLSGAFCGAAVMSKGLLGLVLPGAAIAAFLVWERDWKAFLKMPWTPLLGAVAVAGPWVLAQHSVEPDFWRYFIMVEHFGRFVGDAGERHPQPFWLYVPILLGGFLPFTLFAYSLFKGGRKMDWGSPLLRFCVAWIAVPFILLSLSSGKLGTYILPLFPPLALLAACAFNRSLEGEDSRHFDYVAKAVAVIFAVAAILLLALQLSPLEAAKVYSKGELVKGLLAAISLFIAAALFRASAKGNEAGMKLGLLCAAPLALMLCWHFAFPGIVAKSKAPEGFLQSARPASEMRMIATADLVGSACLLYGRDDVTVYRKPGEFVYGIKSAAPERRFMEEDELKALLKAGVPDNGLAMLLPSRVLKKSLAAELQGLPFNEDTNGSISLITISGKGGRPQPAPSR